MCYGIIKPSRKGWNALNNNRLPLWLVILISLLTFPVSPIVLACMYDTEKRKNDTAAYNNRKTVNQLSMSPERISREADSMRRASESALRARAEALVQRYDQSALVADLVNTIRGCIQYGIIWDIDLNDGDVVITTMTDALENRICLMTERYDYQSMGYQDPPRESEHRLALALALQKKLGMDYGIEYQFLYNPVTENFVLSDLMVSYRKKGENGIQLKAPI